MKLSEMIRTQEQILTEDIKPNTLRKLIFRNENSIKYHKPNLADMLIHPFERKKEELPPIEYIPGYLWSWGINSAGQLGDNTTTRREAPIKIGNNNDWVDVKGGGQHSVALKNDNSLYMWGNGTNGALSGMSTVRVPTKFGDDKWRLIQYISDSNTFLIAYNGRLWGCGRNNQGQVGAGFVSTSINILTQITDHHNWIKLYNSQFTIGLGNNGIAWSWGWNQYGQLGNGNTTNNLIPTAIPNHNWTDIAAGSAFCLALKQDGTLWSWGYNANGELGQNHYQHTNRDILQVGIDTDWKFITCGQASSYAIKKDGTLWAWGNNTHGRLGLGDTNNRNVPTQVGIDNTWKYVSSNTHTYAIKEDGTAWSWGGGNYNGELGHGNRTQQFSPTQIGTDNNWLQINAGSNHCLAIRS